MAIAFDQVTADTNSGATNTTLSSPNITVTAGNPILFAYVIAASALTNVAATYNSVSMTLIDSNTTGSASFMYIFALVNPTTGSALPVVGTWNSQSGYKSIAAVSYTGASQSGVPTNISDTNNSGTTASGSFTTSSTANSWAIAFARNESGLFSAGTNTTIRQTDVHGNVSADSNGTVPTSSSYNQTLPFSGGSGFWRMTQVELNPSGGTATLASRRTLLGVGI